MEGLEIPESWQPFTKEPPAKRGALRAIPPQRKWTRCVMPTQSHAVYCGKPGTWDDEFGATLCEYHSEREALKRQLKAEEIAEHLPAQVALNTLLDSMRAHPAGWRKRMHEEWGYLDPDSDPFADNRGGK